MIDFSRQEASANYIAKVANPTVGELPVLNSEGGLSKGGITLDEYNKVMAEAFNNLYKKVEAVTDMVHKIISGEMTVAALNVEDLKGIWGSNKDRLVGTGAPAVIPDYAGQMYFDKSAGTLYVAKDCTAIADWAAI